MRWANNWSSISRGRVDVCTLNEPVVSKNTHKWTVRPKAHRRISRSSRWTDCIDYLMWRHYRAGPKGHDRCQAPLSRRHESAMSAAQAANSRWGTHAYLNNEWPRQAQVVFSASFVLEYSLALESWDNNNICFPCIPGLLSAPLFALVQLSIYLVRWSCFPIKGPIMLDWRGSTKSRKQLDFLSRKQLSLSTFSH